MKNTYSRQELKKISLDFRTISSRLLRSHLDDVDNNLTRFLAHINQTTIIKDYIASLSNLTFDIEKDLNSRGHHDIIPIPTSPEEEAGYVLHLMTYLEGQPQAILNITHGYGSGTKLQDHLDAFLRRVFQPFINHINTNLEHLIIDLDDEARHTGTKIEINNSQGVNIANNGSTASLSASFQGNNIGDLGQRVLEALEKEQSLSANKRDEIKVLVEYLIEEGNKEKPNLRFFPRFFNQLKELATAANFGVETGETIIKFLALVQQIHGLS